MDNSHRRTEPMGARREAATVRQPAGVNMYGTTTDRWDWQAGQRSSYRAASNRAATNRVPRRRRRWPWGFTIFAVLLFGMAGCGVVGLLGVFDWGRPDIDIPEDVPPAPGAALPAIDVDAPGRSADQLEQWAAGIAGDTDIPQHALEAYGYAAAVFAVRSPECGIAWTTLAGIGSVESDHGRHDGASIEANGDAVPAIRGLPLDGNGGRAEIRDTDGGALDGDTELDRAMGPMQFIPETWQRWGVDANGDGVASPDNIDDAALTAARYLCDRGGALTTPDGWSAALYAYNLSGSYQLEVRDRAAAYALGIEPR